MKTDIEILNLAAYAMGIEIQWTRPYVSTGDFAQVPNWDPLTNDMDAIEVANKFHWYDAVALDGKSLRTWTGETTEEARAKTRRAITTKAAVIGRTLGNSVKL